MGQAFDPYHKWLGIPPEQQPPNHYRLLGVQTFETDPDVIDSAADQRMAHLRRFQTGGHVERAQRLLNHVAAARICLLDSSKRAAYDEQLRQTLSDTNTPTAVSSNPFPIIDGEYPRQKLYRKKKPPIGSILCGAIVVAAAALAIVAWQRIQDDSSTSHQQPTTRSAPTRPNQTSVGAEQDRAATEAKENQPNHRQEAVGGKPMKPKAPSPDEATPERVRDALALEIQKSAPAYAPPMVVEDRSEVPPDRPADEQLPMAAPSPDRQESAMAQIREQYKQDLAIAKTPEARHVLAGDLLRRTSRTPDRDPAIQYASICLAEELAIQAVDNLTAFRAVELLAERFDIDEAARKADVLAEIARKAKNASQHAVTAKQSLHLAEQAVDKGRFPLAVQLAKLAVAEGGKGRDKETAIQARECLQKARDALNGRGAAHDAKTDEEAAIPAELP